MSTARRRIKSGQMILGAARIEAEVRAKGGDPLASSELAERATTPLSEAPPIGMGGEIVPIEALGFSAPELCNTLQNPSLVTADASVDRLHLLDRAGVLELGVDAAQTIAARDSLERMLAHQMAASHRSSMKMTEQLNACLGRMNHGYVDERDKWNVQATRLAGAIARMNGSFQSGLLTLHKVRTGGRQTVVVQHVNVNDGGQALVAGEMQTGGMGAARTGDTTQK